MGKKMVYKRPSLQFYPGDWLRDVELQSATAATKGVWINVLCRMWDNRERGEITGDMDLLARLCMVSNYEFEGFCNEAEALQFCYMKRSGNGVVTLRNRRMYAEHNAKRNTRLRVAIHREKRQGNAKVTPPSSSSSSSSSSKASKKASIRYDQTSFDQFWAVYPRKIGKQKAVQWWKIHKPDAERLAKMLSTIEAFKGTEQWRDPKLVPHPMTWLNRGGWDDEVSKEGSYLFDED